MNTYPQSQLSAILKKSEAHAMKWSIDWGTSGRIVGEQTRKGYLTISATSKVVKKAIALYEVFLNRMFKEGFSLTLDCDKFYHMPASAIIVDGEMIPIRIKETHVLITRMEDNQVRRDFPPTGELAIEIYGGTGHNPTKILKETKTSTWEEVIENVIPYLHKAAAIIRTDRLKWEEWRRRMDEAERQRKEHEQAIDERFSMVKSILEDMWMYKRAVAIRKYCDVFEQKAISASYLKKIEAARQFADWIDPTIDYEDELLSERYDPKSFLG